MLNIVTSEDITAYLDDPTAVSQETLQARLNSVLTQAALVAPCITEPDFTLVDELVAIIGPIVARWVRAGAGGIASESRTVGPMSLQTSYDSRVSFGDRLTREEKANLAALCRGWRGGRRSRAFSVVPR